MSTLTPPTRPGTRPTSLGYKPALDGLRAIALIAIIVYHSGLSFAPGAFLSVSTFFTLSGFLITALMLAEQERNGSVSLRSFWARRLRRLMPAALTAITLIVAASIWLADSTQLVRLRADALSALAYVANWRFIAAGDAYGATFESPSPFTHFWTLAIEEQFYIVLPLLVVGALVVGRGSRRAVAAALTGVGALAIIWANLLVNDAASINRLYFGTDVRSVELITGALLAVWWMRRPDPLSPQGKRVIAVASPIGLVVMVVLWITADLQEQAFYRGGLTLYTLLTLLAIVGSLQDDGIVRQVLSWKPLVWIGTVSYGAYLFHYPVLIWFGQYSSWPAAVRLLLSLPVIFALAELSARFIERPIRSGGALRPSRAVLIGGGSVAVTLAVIFSVTGLVRPEDTTDLEAAAELQRFVEQTQAQEASEAPRISLFGDSTALMTALGMSEFSRQEPDLFVSDGGWADLGCGLIADGQRRARGEQHGIPEHCANWLEEWERTSAERPQDVAVVQLGPWEVHDQQLEPGGPFVAIGEDPTMDAELTERLRLGVETLLEHHEMVVLLSSPDIDPGRIDGRSPTQTSPESDPSRMQRFREILGAVAAEYDGVETLDLAGWLASHAEERRIRPDGVHFTDTTTVEVAQWLAPQVVELYERTTGRTDSTVAAES